MRIRKRSNLSMYYGKSRTNNKKWQSSITSDRFFKSSTHLNYNKVSITFRYQFATRFI